MNSANAGGAEMVVACLEPQHSTMDLRSFTEHNGEWVECFMCGRQWVVHGSHAEVVSEGDGYCDRSRIT